ncbi:MAG TPA: hypothetical protein VD929_07405 [Caulobacteraceae bacterium]|nr:hypothetical protein [Caulobacteraceae bacterium]
MRAPNDLFMRPGAVRGLSPAERALTVDIFGGAVNLDRVRIWSCPTALVNRAFVAGRWFGRTWIVMPRRSALLDFGAATAPIARAALFVHEMTHVWQAQQGLNLLLAKLRAGDRADSYRYDLGAVGDWWSLNIEQQAMVVEDEFRRRRGGNVLWPAEAYRRILPFGGGTEVA